MSGALSDFLETFVRILGRFEAERKSPVVEFEGPQQFQSILESGKPVVVACTVPGHPHNGDFLPKFKVAAYELRRDAVFVHCNCAKNVESREFCRSQVPSTFPYLSVLHFPLIEQLNQGRALAAGKSTSFSVRSLPYGNHEFSTYAFRAFLRKTGMISATQYTPFDPTTTEQ